MILAAGLGTRLRPFTEVTPKPLLPLMGVPLLQWTLDFARTAGVSRAVINTHHLASVLKAGVASLDTQRISVSWSDETEKILGSGGGIAQALKLLPPQFLALNADTVCGFDLQALVAKHRQSASQGGLATLAIRKKPRGSPYAGLALAGDRIRQFRTPEGSHFYVGAMVLEAQAFQSAPLGEFDLIEAVLAPLAAQGRVNSLEVTAPFFDIGSPPQWAQAHFDLMTSDLLPERVSRTCQRHPGGVWTLKGVAPPTEARGPLFWGVPASASASPPASTSGGPAGPHAVIYDPFNGPPWVEGIWYGRRWASLSPTPPRAGRSPKPGKP